MAIDPAARLTTNWSERSVVEVIGPDASRGWFLHALTGDEWLLTLKFRVPENTFQQKSLAAALKLKPHQGAFACSLTPEKAVAAVQKALPGYKFVSDFSGPAGTAFVAATAAPAARIVRRVDFIGTPLKQEYRSTRVRPGEQPSN